MFILGIVCGLLGNKCDEIEHELVRILSEAVLALLMMAGVLIGVICVVGGIIGLCAGVMV